MAPFVQHGDDCFVVDFNEDTVDGVTHLASKLQELPGGACFDVIICSHVIEHQTEPLMIVRGLVSHLKPNGLFYAEVPADLFASIPIEQDPVTHVGFYCMDSLRVLLEMSGLHVIKRRAQVGTYNDSVLHILWSLAKKVDMCRAPDFIAGSRNAQRCLNPGVFRMLGRRYHPQYLWGKARRHFHYHHAMRKFVRRWGRRVKAKFSFQIAHT